MGRAGDEGDGSSYRVTDQNSGRVANIEDSVDMFDTRSGKLNGKTNVSCTARNRVSNPTMIICNPNAGFYEFMYYEVYEIS